MKLLVKDLELVIIDSLELEGIRLHKERYGFVELECDEGVDPRDVEAYIEYDEQIVEVTRSIKIGDDQLTDPETGQTALIPIYEEQLVEETIQVPRIEYRESQDKKNSRLINEINEKLEQIRSIRNSKLSRVDQLVNIAFLDSWTAAEKTELKNYRQSLLDITEPYKIIEGVSDLESLASINVEEILWPQEPTES